MGSGTHVFVIKNNMNKNIGSHIYWLLGKNYNSINSIVGYCLFLKSKYNYYIRYALIIDIRKKIRKKITYV
jgi:uncharacterized protein (UPF0297 family)